MTKSILITGSTDGIGKLAALKLAQAGHDVYVHGRNAEKLKAVISEIKTNSGHTNVKGYISDFSDLKSVKEMAQRIHAEIPQLDVLINNAGVYKSSISQTPDDLDIRFAVNYFAPYILTTAILPLLNKRDGSRIINLSSAAQAPVSADALSGKTPLTAMEAYAQSKLAIAMWSFYLAKTKPNLNVIAVNPGSLLNTNMVKEGWGYHRSSADKGRDILFDLAISDAYDNASGKYFDNDIGSFGPIHPAGNDSEAIHDLIKNTEAGLANFHNT